MMKKTKYMVLESKNIKMKQTKYFEFLWGLKRVKLITEIGNWNILRLPVSEYIHIKNKVMTI